MPGIGLLFIWGKSMDNVKHILFKPRLLFLVSNFDDDVRLEPMQVIMRIIVFIITAGWIGFLPSYLFLIYMRENRFFSYDFFVEGVFGLNTFIVAAAVILVILSFYFYGFFILLKLGLQQQKKEGKNGYRFAAWVSFFLSVFMHVVLFEFFLEIGKPYFFFWLMGISAIFCALFYSLVGYGFKRSIQNWLSPVLFLAASIILPFMNHGVTAEMISMALRNFNMGGGKNIQIESKNEEVEYKGEGKLILLTPRNAYIESVDEKLLIVPISNHTEITVW